MEAQAQAQAQHTRSPTLPPYEQWPSVPQSSPGVQARNNDTINIPAEHAIHIKSQRERDTSLLSMDDIEAAQALEGLRAGKQSLAIKSGSLLT